MDYERKGVTIDWQIENAKYIREQKMELYSPVVTVDAMDGTKWRLGLRHIFASDICLIIKREAEDDGQEEVRLHCEFSAYALDATSSTRKRVCTYSFQKDQKCPEVKVNHGEAEKLLSTDSITIRCKLYKQRGSIPNPCYIFSRTRMKTESSVFVGKVENFSNFSESERKTLKIVSSPTGERLMTVNLCLSDRRTSNRKIVKDLRIEIRAIGKQPVRIFHFELFLLDYLGSRRELGEFKGELKLKTVAGFRIPNVTKGLIMQQKARYLPNDTLSLHCEITFCSGKEYEKIERILYATDSSTDQKQTDFSNSLELLMSKKGIPCDAEIETTTETFPVHTDILSAQSPIFDAMFKANMKETTEKCVRMDDVDAETVERILMFLYSGTLEELEWIDAMELYIAADKYQIHSLKTKCFSFLVHCIDLSNYCVLLILAYEQNDKDLKRAVQNYMVENGRFVLHCCQWLELEKKRPRLAIEILRDLYLSAIML